MCGGRPQVHVALYDHVLTRVCAHVAGCDPGAFCHVEQTVVAGLLSGRTWQALLAGDLWAFLARWGESVKVL